VARALDRHWSITHEAESASDVLLELSCATAMRTRPFTYFVVLLSGRCLNLRRRGGETAGRRFYFILKGYCILRTK
jgi:hypothetical protein